MGLAVVAAASAAPAEAAGTSYQALSLSAVVTGNSVTASTTVAASTTTQAQYYGVCVRSASDANRDFTKVAATITPAGTPFRSEAKTFAPGTYSYFPCLYVNRVWTNVGAAKTFTVGDVGPALQSTPSVVAGDGKVTLTWTGVAGATGFHVGRDGFDTSGSGAFSTTDPAGARSRVFDHLVNERRYTFFVEPAVPGGVRRTISATPSATTATTPVTPTPTPRPTPTGTAGDTTPGWLSGASSGQAADGQMGRWRGSAIEIGGTWQNDPALYSLQRGGEWGSFGGPMDLGWTPPNWSGWAAEANGAHDAFWTSMFRTARKLRAGKGTTYIRPWYEYNGNWMSYSVKPGQEALFKQAFARVDAIQNREFPEAKLMLGTSAGGPISVAGTYPASGVDVLSIDFYNNWPFCTTTDCFEKKIKNGAGQNSLEVLRKLAKSKGDPVLISEWSTQGKAQPASSGGGGESPQFIRDWNAWLRANAGTGPGDVLAEVQFNLWPDQFEFFTTSARTTALQPRTAEEYRRLW